MKEERYIKIILIATILNLLSLIINIITLFL